MTRNRKIDPEVLEREYIFDSSPDPVSFTDLAIRHGLARNTVAAKGTAGKWFERREEFRRQLGIGVTNALGEQWVRFETQMRERLLSVGMKAVERYEKNFDDPDFKVGTRDLLGVASMLRTFAGDAALAQGKEEVLDGTEASNLTEAEYRRALGVIDRLTAGQGHAGEAPAAGAPGAGED